MSYLYDAMPTAVMMPFVLMNMAEPESPRIKKFQKGIKIVEKLLLAKIKKKVIKMTDNEF